jgi:hypothetical protein
LMRAAGRADGFWLGSGGGGGCGGACLICFILCAFVTLFPLA